jgi:LPS O-antigen subunit length determinant protein (WzzB/FepE family)
MNNLQRDQSNNNYDNEIDIYELFFVLWSRKFYILGITTVFAFISIQYALMLPNIYKSKAVMMPVESGSGGRVIGQYSRMASLAGISLPSESGSKSKEAIARIQSFEFFSNHFLPNVMLENLIAVKEWNQENNTLAYEENIFNIESNKWVRKVEPPKSIIPSPQEAYIIYKNIISIEEGNDSLFISLSIKHKSPFIAQQWVQLIIDRIDYVMREKDKQEAMKSVKYLNSLAPTVKYEEIKKALSSLQQEQMKQLMMVEASENYIFKVLDSPIVPEARAEPQRSKIVILFTMIGLMLSVIGSLAFHFLKKSYSHS